MPVVTINKTVALFLVGYLGLGILAIIGRQPLFDFWRSHQELSSASGSVALGLLSLAIAALMGAIIDGLADVTIRRLIKWGAAHKTFACFFGQSRVFHSVAIWRAYFNEQIVQSDLDLFHKIAGDQGLAQLHLATGLLHVHAPPHHVEWIYAHYSTHHLASNLAFIALAGPPAVAVTIAAHDGVAIGWIIATGLAMIIAAYGLLSLSLDRCLYTYQAEFRFAAIWLAELEATKGAKLPGQSRQGTRLTRSPLG
jgi:hypothetical protein